MNVMTYPRDQKVNDAAVVLLEFSHTLSDAEKVELTNRTMTASCGGSLLAKRQLHDKALYYGKQAKRWRLIKRSVRFSGAETHVFDKVGKENAAQVWWTRYELHHICKRERAMVGVLSHYCGFYAEQLARLMQVSRDEATDVRKETSPVWVCNSQGRGLESQVTAVLTGSSDDARKVVRTVVQTQRLLQAHFKERGLTSASPAAALGICDILRAQYEELSLHNKRYAQLLAVGDALVARVEDDLKLACATSSCTLPSR